MQSFTRTIVTEKFDGTVTDKFSVPSHSAVRGSYRFALRLPQHNSAKAFLVLRPAAFIDLSPKDGVSRRLRCDLRSGRCRPFMYDAGEVAPDLGH
jgi:hypothetical protein